MALLVLIMLGATLGWLATIVTRNEAPGVILRQISAGVVASLAAGLFANQFTILGGLSLVAIGVASAAAIGVLVVYNAIAQRRADA
ncbi:MAG: hypothetical protein AAF494_01515 [Pseudomonadota bacterium]